MTQEFEPPPKGWNILATAGGIVTAVAAIAGLEWISQQVPRPAAAPIAASQPSLRPMSAAEFAKVARQDAQSMKLPGTPVSQKQLAAAQPPYIAPQTGRLSQAETQVARQAWSYFERNWNDSTGLVNSVDSFPSVTLWDQAAGMAALVSAHELRIISNSAFETKMRQMLKTLATLPLYRQELPNKVYNAKTLLPVDYGQLDKRQEIGWSAIDLGRMALWLKIIEAKYPQFRPQVRAIWNRLQVDRLVKNGQMYGTRVVQGKEQYNQEGRLGYENYAAYGLKLWGLDVKKALNPQANVAFVNLYKQGVPYDKRDAKTLGANNYVLSEPYILDGIETGFQALPKPYSDRVLAAQTARYQATQQLTALTEDNLDRAPYFVYSTLFVNGTPWATINDTGKQFNQLRFLSTKAAIGWYVLYPNTYTQTLFNFVQTHLKSGKGWYNGFYEALRQPNKALTANNNGIILESLLYKQVGQPLTLWAGVKASR